MIFTESGDKSNKTIILLHGGGLSAWSLEKPAALLAGDYHVVTTIIDGHGDDAKTEFVSIEASASKLVEYIDAVFNGTVFAIAGLSLGAQIAAEALAQRPDITESAVLESGLMMPLRGTRALVVPSLRLFYGLIGRRWFAKTQARSLGVPPELFERYFEDSKKMTKTSLISLMLSNGTYAMKEAIRGTRAKVLVIVGSRELGIMKRSADLLRAAIPGSTLRVATGMRHGELSLSRPQEYVRLLRKFFGE